MTLGAFFHPTTLVLELWGDLISFCPRATVDSFSCPRECRSLQEWQESERSSCVLARASARPNESPDNVLPRAPSLTWWNFLVLLGQMEILMSTRSGPGGVVSNSKTKQPTPTFKRPPWAEVRDGGKAHPYTRKPCSHSNGI